MSKPTWKLTSKNVVEARIPFEAGRGDVLSEKYPEIADLVAFLTKPIPSSEVSQQERLVGSISMGGSVSR